MRKLLKELNILYRQVEKLEPYLNEENYNSIWRLHNLFITVNNFNKE